MTARLLIETALRRIVQVKISSARTCVAKRAQTVSDVDKNQVVPLQHLYLTITVQELYTAAQHPITRSDLVVPHR